jgi:Tfp pilus assembly protein PilN
MINLLPPDLKDQYLYGRRNTSMRRWAVALTFGLVGVALVTVSGLFYMEQSIKNYSEQVSATDSLLQKQNLTQTKEQAQEITSNLKLAVDVLSKEVLFSKLLTQIGKVIPPNTNLTDLSISEVGGGIELSAVSADYNSATQLQVNLEDPDNRIFSKADIQNINCSTQSADPRYPCTVAIRALFSENNPYLFINKETVKR